MKSILFCIALFVSLPMAFAVELLPIEIELLRETNAARARYGLPPLVIDPTAQANARQQSIAMCSRGMTHWISRYRFAENIAAGQRTSREVVKCWVNSPGHFANLMNRRHRYVGVSVYKSRVSGRHYWTQNFR